MRIHTIRNCDNSEIRAAVGVIGEEKLNRTVLLKFTILIHIDILGIISAQRNEGRLSKIDIRGLDSVKLPGSVIRIIRIGRFDDVLSADHFVLRLRIRSCEHSCRRQDTAGHHSRNRESHDPTTKFSE